MKLVRYGILGFGLHAVRRLMPSFPAAEDSSVSGLWRRDMAKAKADAAEWKIPHAFSTPEELCASPDVDAVFVASPDALHLKHTLLAMEHGKPVLCEKPLGMSAAEAEEMTAAANKAGVLFGVAQNFRFNHSVDIIRDWVSSGRIGKPQLSHAQFAYPANKSARTWIADPGLACGGPIGDVGVHCIDTLRYILNEDVLSVSTLARKADPADDVEAVASMQMEMSRSYAQVTVSARAPYRSLLEIVGDAGVIVAENGLSVDHTVEVTLRNGGELTETVILDNSDCYTLMFDCFARAVRGEDEYPSTGADGVVNMRILDAAYKSWRTGARETV